MHPSSSGAVLSVENLGPITKAEIDFGDLTVLVGPQASGKSILLQTLKLQLDARHIATRLRKYGFTWERADHETFLELYFGEGLGGLWSDKTRLRWNGKATEAQDLMSLAREDEERVLVSYIPAQRVLVMQNGWPRHFESYSQGDPYVVKGFSEYLRLQMERGSARDGAAVFPQKGLLTAETRELLTKNIFGGFALKQATQGAQRRLVLQHGDRPPLPFMVWSAGQREFSPLLLGIYGHLPEGSERLSVVEWIVLEEPEMGLHPRAISAVLFMVLELLNRGYRVCISTHSPHVLDLVWALRVLIEHGAPPEVVLKLFAVAASPASLKMAAAILQKKLKVYSFNRDGRPVADISRLDPDSASPEELSWGGLTEFSARTADVVADFIASRREADSDEP
ncbi:MAG TPA: AAA family ATPase [Pseudomonadota bacterium]|nr:AAA family ATPase [Pseudomonadota bacterium]